MNAKIAKGAAKLVLGLAFSAMIGIMIKTEETIKERIDEHFDHETPIDQEDQ